MVASFSHSRTVSGGVKASDASSLEEVEKNRRRLVTQDPYPLLITGVRILKKILFLSISASWHLLLARTEQSELEYRATAHLEAKWRTIAAAAARDAAAVLAFLATSIVVIIFFFIVHPEPAEPQNGGRAYLDLLVATYM